MFLRIKQVEITYATDSMKTLSACQKSRK